MISVSAVLVFRARRGLPQWKDRDPQQRANRRGLYRDAREVRNAG
jgi:hypothetical protein